MMTGVKPEYVNPWRNGKFSYFPLLYFLFPNKFHSFALFLCRVAYTLHGRKLTALNSNEIADREQRMLTGGGDYRCGCITVCGENTCVCLDEGDTLPSETAYSYFASNPEGENLNINTANYNYERFIMP